MLGSSAEHPKGSDMTAAAAPSPVSIGDPAPEFVLAAVDRNETVSLADYRGRSPLFLALFIGLWCPFCRRSLAQMGTTEARLKASGIETRRVAGFSPAAT
jgi:peroxiredoxin